MAPLNALESGGKVWGRPRRELPKETQKQVAAFNKDKTCSVVPYMEEEGDFLRWLYEEAEKGQWDQKMVFAALVKEEVDGKSVIVPRRKKGKTFVNIQLHSLFKTIFPQCSSGNEQQWSCWRLSGLHNGQV